MKTCVIVILMAGLMLGCDQQKDVRLRFSAEVDGTPLTCDRWYAGYDSSGDASIQIKDFRFFVSDVRLINDRNEEVPVLLEQDSIWQFQDIALLDFEDGTGECEEKGTAQINSMIKGRVEGSRFKGIVFKMGLPFEWNHVDNVAVPSPLNIGAMFWNWQYGYKFARFDLVTDREDDRKFWFIHLGSTGCTSGAAGMAPDSACLKTNIPEIRIDNFDIENDVIVADLGSLIRGLKIGTCMSGPANPFCEELFPGFGLSLASGTCKEDCEDQQLFRRRSSKNVAYAAE